MLTLKKIAVTGSLSSGKSLVCKFLEELGAFVVSADSIVYRLLSTQPLHQQVVNLLGDGILVDNSIDRSRVAEIVFKNPEKLVALEEILHPVVKKEIETAYYHEAHKEILHQTLFVAEIPLLYEMGWESFFDAVLLIVSDIQLAKMRFCKKGHSKKDFSLRMKRQWPSSRKQEKAPFILTNNGSIDDLKQKVFEFYNHYI